MIELLLYSSLSCIDAQAIIDRVNKHSELDKIVKRELIETIKEAAEDCTDLWDAND